MKLGLLIVLLPHGLRDLWITPYNSIGPTLRGYRSEIMTILVKNATSYFYQIIIASGLRKISTKFQPLTPLQTTDSTAIFV
jgi:hypothetical protein